MLRICCCCNPPQLGEKEESAPREGRDAGCLAAEAFRTDVLFRRDSSALREPVVNMLLLVVVVALARRNIYKDV
jgi:hypothetical protein